MRACGFTVLRLAHCQRATNLTIECLRQVGEIDRAHRLMLLRTIERWRQANVIDSVGECGGAASTHGSELHPTTRVTVNELAYSHSHRMVSHMKVSLNIDDSVVTQFRREAARTGRTMSELVETALRNLLQSRREQEPLPPLPTFNSGGALVDIAFPANRCTVRFAFVAAIGLQLAAAVSLPAQQAAVDVITTSEYVRTRDGTRLAVDVHLPKTRAAGERLPALLELTRYWRASENATTGVRNPSLNSLDRFFLHNGYAVVKVDARGSGASFGTRPVEYGVQKTRDAYDIVDWLVRQPWSSGSAGAYGTSYSGTTAELLAAVEHPAVKAVVPGWSDFDAYTSPVRPYGLLTAFAEEWGGFVGALDRNDRAVMKAAARRVDADSSGALVAAAVAEHARNPDVAKWAKQVEFRDDRYEGGPSYHDIGPVRWKREIERSNVPMLVLVSRLDAGTTEGALDRLRAFRNVQKLVIMASSHGGGAHASPFVVDTTPVRGNPTQDEMAQMRLQFFDRYLKGVKNSVDF